MSRAPMRDGMNMWVLRMNGVRRGTDTTVPVRPWRVGAWVIR
jgi:hypothetical protein